LPSLLRVEERRPVAWKPDTSDTNATSRPAKKKEEKERNGSSLMRVDTSAGVLVGPFALFPSSILAGDEVFSELENLSNNVASAKTSCGNGTIMCHLLFILRGETVVSEISKMLVCSVLNFNERVSSEF